MHAPTISALDSIEQYSQLHAQVAESLTATRWRIDELLRYATPRSDILATIASAATTLSGAVIALEGSPGSGVTTTLCQLATISPALIWLPGADAQQGLALLCAQLIALYDLPVALVPPNAGCDAITFERLLAEAAIKHANADPLLLLVDDFSADDAPLSTLFSPNLPNGVVLIVGMRLQVQTPIRPALRITLPEQHTPQLEQVTIQAGIPAAYAPAIATSAAGAFIYPTLATALLNTGQFNLQAPPYGLTALYQHWWQTLDLTAQVLFKLLAAAAEPIELTQLAQIADCPIDMVEKALRPWEALLIWHSNQVALAQRSMREHIAATSGDHLATTHATFVRILRPQASEPQPSGYLIRQYARHVALSDRQTRTTILPTLAQRAWIVAQQRRTGSMQQPARDVAWGLGNWGYATAVSVAGRGALNTKRDPALISAASALHLVRAAALAGTMALLARSLAPDAPGIALKEALQHGVTREVALRRTRAMIDQLPDGRDKAVVLRRLGDACYTLNLRAPAMRMLSEALDLEHQGLPRSWHVEREETLVALARAAIAHGSPAIALGITTLIAHPERRGLIDTEVVRHLIADTHLTRAEEVAYAISHTSTHEWAMAEVAVAWARSGDQARSADVLTTLRTNTAIAWATGELACDAAQRGDSHAAVPILALAMPALRNRGLAQVARALTLGGQPAAAFQATIAISDPELRARALVGIAEADPHIAAEALNEAEYAIGPIIAEDSASIRAAIAAAHAASGWLDRALQTAEVLPPGEEHDRIMARIAVALARRGNDLEAQNIAFGIPDDDEREWALDELARQLAHSTRWPEAFALAAQIHNIEQRARTEADLAIAWARGGDPISAQAHAERIAHAAERVRALCAIAPALVAAGYANQFRPAATRTPTLDLRSRYQTAAVQALAASQQASGATQGGQANEGLDLAEALVSQIARPMEQARALIAITRAAALAGEPTRSQAALANAFRRTAQLGRNETFSCIASAADVFLLLAGPEILLAIASALDEIDGWWA